MKTLHENVRGYLLALLLLTGLHSFVMGQNCIPDKADFSMEFPIAVNTGGYILNAGQISEKENRFKKCVKCSPELVDCPEAPTKIPASAIKSTLYNEAENLRQQLSACSDKTCITGVWLIYGMENGTIRYMFRTGVLKTKQGLTARYPSFDSLKFGQVHIYTGSKFEPLKKDQWKKLQDEYFDKIMVQRFEDSGRPERGGHRRPDGTLESGWKGNSRMLFYSFQEILGFYSKRNPKEETNRLFYCGNIYVNHSAGKFYRTVVNRRHVKHNTFITVDTGEEKGAKDQAITAISVDGADLAHVCPSRCNELEYPSAAELQSIMKKEERRTKNKTK